MSNSTALDVEFEQVLGSWLDHCSESLSLQQQQTSSQTSTLELLQQNDNTGMLLITPSLLLHFKKELEQDSALISVENENNKNDNMTASKLEDSAWLLTARSTIDRFKSMIPDNMEKLREIFKVIFTRVRDSTAQATSQFLIYLKRQKLQTLSNREDDDDVDQHGEDDLSRRRNIVFLPKRFSGVSRNKNTSSSNNNNNNRQTTQHQQHFSILEPSPELAHLVRRSIFYWLIFDTLIQAFPLVACQWCIQCRDDFFSLVEHALPWEYACEWCDFTVLNCWVPLFRNFSGSPSSVSSSSTTTTTTMGGDFASRLEAIALQRRASVVLAQSLAAEQSRKRRIEIEESNVRDASTQEMRQLHELAQRLIAALNRHKPNDGRLAVVKLENNYDEDRNEDGDDDDQFRVKKENFHVESTRLKAQALHFKDIGNDADRAWDVDEEYEPGYVAGARMDTLKKLGNDDDVKNSNQNAHNEDAAQTASNNNKSADNDEGQQGGRRAPRVRPR